MPVSLHAVLLVLRFVEVRLYAETLIISIFSIRVQYIVIKRMIRTSQTLYYSY